MSLGTKIKAARLEAGLSQRALCGEVITRNMLSLIEQGRAYPSMETLQHFAAALCKPMSYFLEEDTVYSPNQAAMIAAEAAFRDGAYEAVLVSLENYNGPDPVFDNLRYLLECLACQRLAEQAIAGRKNTYALALLKQSEAAAAKTPYAPSPDSCTVARWKADPTTAGKAVLDTTELLLVRAERAVLAEDYPLAIRILEATENRPHRWHLLRGISALHTGDLPQAVRSLQSAEPHFPRIVPPLLEQAYLQQQDFKRAYEYKNK